MTAAEKVISIAAAEVGYREKASNGSLDDKTANAGSGNWTKYARDLDATAGFYNGAKNGYAWCDVFVDWCFYKAFGAAEAKRLLCQPDRSAGAGCLYSLGYYRNKGQFYTSGPKPGDQIFFGSSTADVTHTGLVERVAGSTVYTIEGNTSDCVARRSYSVSSGSIVGYGRPAYNDDVSTPPSSGEAQQQTPVQPAPPVQQQEPEPEVVDGLYTVKPGDTLIGIARKTLGDPNRYRDIQKTNGLVSTLIYVGQKLRIPGAGEESVQEHVVKPGDSLWGISALYLGNGARYREIMELNGMKGDIIYPGQKLKIPEK